MTQRFSYRLMRTIAQISLTRHDTKMLIPIHGDYTSNFSKTRHDTKILIQNSGRKKVKIDYHRKRLASDGQKMFKSKYHKVSNHTLVTSHRTCFPNPEPG